MVHVASDVGKYGARASNAEDSADAPRRSVVVATSKFPT